MKTFTAFVAASVLAFTGLRASAAINVGEQAKLSYETVDGKKIDVEKLHGKIVVVDFWATWCGPCMQEAPHIVSINQKYADKGLVMLGISLDADRAKMLAVAKEKGFNWPQYFDGQVWMNKVFKQWGTTFIPLTVVIDANGKVVFADNPGGQLDAAIEKAFKDTPPTLVDPKTLADANKTLDLIEQKLKGNDAKGAVKLLGKIPPSAKSDPDFAKRSGDVQKQLEDAGEAMLAEVDPLISKGDYKTAVAHLRDVSVGLAGLPASAKAKKMLIDLTGKPEVKAALADADKSAKEEERESKADEALALATKLSGEKKDEQAYVRFKSIAADFPGTRAAATASEQVKKYDSAHPEMAQKLNDSATATKAKSALSMAGSYERSGRNDLAKAKYQSVIDSFPNTTYAEEAKKALARIGE